ncbi:hypothetical protein KDA23_02565 [Candidatus Saccharibacteria bacterium]|nr:hypothetical protein [Candidatus Saccharibacteria bacterium]
MRINRYLRDQVVVEKEDHPELVAEALVQVDSLFRQENPWRLRPWFHCGPDGHDLSMLATMPEWAQGIEEHAEVFTHASPNEFELALVYYGVRHIEDATKVERVNELLSRLDLCRDQVDLAVAI